MQQCKYHCTSGSGDPDDDIQHGGWVWRQVESGMCCQQQHSGGSTAGCRGMRSGLLTSVPDFGKTVYTCWVFVAHALPARTRAHGWFRKLAVFFRLR